MTNKKELLAQYNNLEKEMLLLKDKINKCDEIDIFSIITYPEVCRQLKEKEQTCSFQKIKQLKRFFNQNWIKNLKDTSQKKWYPYFSAGSSGLSFLSSSWDSEYFNGFAGLFQNEKVSSHIGKHFINIYEELANS